MGFCDAGAARAGRPRREVRMAAPPVTSTHANTLAPPTQAARKGCLNCGSVLEGPFCSMCGQRDIPPYPSVRELAIDAFWELSGWDGRFAATVRALVRHPGLLTREFLEGRRARYLSPLRLYLMASLVYFVLAAAAPNPRSSPAGVEVGGLTIGVTTAPGPTTRAPQRVATAMHTALEQRQALASAQRRAALQDIDRAPAVMRPIMRRAVEDPTGFRRGMVDALPRMLFVLLPVFAAIVALFYRRLKYPEHLYFAIHLHAFIFIALAVAVAARFTGVPALVRITGALAALSIPVYATLACRRLYGGSLVVTLAKEVGIAAIYGLVSLVALVLTIWVVSVAG